MEEDLEQELTGEREDDEAPEAMFEALHGIPEDGNEEGDGDAPSGSEFGEASIREAFTAGWRAKAKLNVGKKNRGWSTRQPTTGTPSTSGRSLAEKKRISTCASCGGRGHWKGDPECPHVQAGKDPPHAKRTSGGQFAHEVHFTFAAPHQDHPTPGPRCTACSAPASVQHKFCPECGEKLSNKRTPWMVVQPGNKMPAEVMSEDDPPPVAPPRPMRDGRISKGVLDKVKLGSLEELTRKERKELKQALLMEEQRDLLDATDRHRVLLPRGRRSGDDERGYCGTGVAYDDRMTMSGIARVMGKSTYQDQMPVMPSRLELRAPNRKDERGRDKPKAVRERELEDFHRELYVQRCPDGRRCTPSPASPTPTDTQARCVHPFSELLWTSNAAGHYARCKRCDLKHVLYFSERHGALTSSHTSEPTSTTTGMHQAFPCRPPAGVPGQAVADTGCRTAVGGWFWHELFQEELRKRNIAWLVVEEHETFQFGSGAPEVSRQACIYPIGLHGRVELLRMSVVKGGAMQCPGLIGPSELSRWQVKFDFANRQLEIFGEPHPMRLTATRHPALDLLDFGATTDPWRSPGIEEKKVQLIHAPQSLAFLSQGKSGQEIGEDADAEESDTTGSSSASSSGGQKETQWSHDERRALQRQRRQQRWLRCLAEDLGVKASEGDHSYVPFWLATSP